MTAVREGALERLHGLLPQLIVDEAAAASCTACGGAGLVPFYLAEDVAVQSCVLVSDHDLAISYPRGDILLGLCLTCGFILNVRFEPDRVDYALAAEESQAFSPKFTEFAHALAARLVDEYSLGGKHVLEVGCGKGDFLRLLAEVGDIRGTGIDPGYLPDRTTGPPDDRLRFVTELYSEATTHLTGDLICVRHMLEHIPDVARMLGLLGTSARATPQSRVFIEVPDASRILRERAFWDIYHEHCSYFTSGSLARALRSSEFDVLRLELAFGGQYILADAAPALRVETGEVPREDAPAELVDDVVAFALRCARSIRTWRTRLLAAYEAGRRPVIWGGGSKAAAFLAALGLREELRYAVDINPFKQGRFLPGTGQEVVPPRFLTEYRPELVVVMNSIYEDEIGSDLHAMGLEAEVASV